jgi:MoaA/NifB/PqqE/SkfB family radical SAM enzyme
MDTGGDRAYQENVRLSRLEYQQRHVYLYSRPRCLSIVLGNACNIDCVHCYQAKNGDNLLRPAEVGGGLRRELMAFYPYVSTLRIQGGEVFAMRGFRELVEDVTLCVRRPVLSVSTNGTLIDDQWAEKLVRTPFSNVTVSIDGGTRATYNRLRKGGDLDDVLANIDRINRWKAKLRSEVPHLDSFFVAMRSNFREIPQYLESMQRHGMTDVSLQTMEISPENSARVPSLEADESISDRREVEELHTILREALRRFQGSFRMIRVNGLRTLFERHGLDAQFLHEGEQNLYPDGDDLADGGFGLCPNPWTTLFLVENGDAHLCFLSQPIGNLYSDSLAALWNSPNAIAKRSSMVAGRYLESGCSRQYCGWREGKASPPAPDLTDRRTEWSGLVRIQSNRQPELDASPEALALVRRLMAEEWRKRSVLERQVALAEAKADKAVRDFYELDAHFRRCRRPWPLKVVHKLSEIGRAMMPGPMPRHINAPEAPPLLSTPPGRLSFLREQPYAPDKSRGAPPKSRWLSIRPF